MALASSVRNDDMNQLDDKAIYVVCVYVCVCLACLASMGYDYNQ